VLVLLVTGCLKQQQQQRTTATATPEPPTVAQLASACSLLAQRGVPCRANFNTEAWFMLTHFETQADLDRSAGPLVTNLGIPFCHATRANRRHAKFAVEVHNVGQRHFDCQDGTWSAWIPQPPPPQIGLLPIDQACVAIDRSDTLPLRCKLQRVNGMYKIQIVTHSAHDLALYASWLDHDLLDRFCKQIVDAADGGTIEFQSVYEKSARIVNCETRVMSPLLQLQTPTQREPAPARRPRRPAPETPPANTQTRSL
jgi:hypothetical protein